MGMDAMQLNYYSEPRQHLRQIGVLYGIYIFVILQVSVVLPAISEFRTIECGGTWGLRIADGRYLVRIATWEYGYVPWDFLLSWFVIVPHGIYLWLRWRTRRNSRTHSGEPASGGMRSKIPTIIFCAAIIGLIVTRMINGSLFAL